MNKLLRTVTVLFALSACDPSTSASVETKEAPSREAPSETTELVLSGHPGHSRISRKLKVSIDDEVAKKRAAGGKFRTKHQTDGNPTFSNRLALESSPYLQQHAHNPVNWYPWGAEAFEVALREKKPVLLSIGYSTCHWCHVMEEESFEDKEIAAYMNANYISIKVDREERPDVDEIYMAAVRMFSGRGGWPMTVWLTPDKVPFFGGTYYPPKSGSRGPGFSELLRTQRKAFDTNPEVREKAQQTAERLVKQMEADRSKKLANLNAPLKNAFLFYEQTYDSSNGGWGKRNKFPMPARLLFLSRYFRRSGNVKAKDMFVRSLDAMMNGGLYDHVGYGFHRYTVDRRWDVPHFEKMLYDNGQLVNAYVEGWQLTGDDRYRKVAEDTLDYLLSEMRTPDGTFYAATDADSEGEEGRFFIWKLAELKAALGDDFDVFDARFAVSEKGNLEGFNVLRTKASVADVAKQLSIPVPEVRERLERARVTLFEIREKRERPHRDDKIITAWNGLALMAFANAGRAFAEPRFVTAAERLADALLETMIVGDDLFRTRVGTKMGTRAVASDYAFLIAGLIDTAQATTDGKYVAHAVKLQTMFDEKFGAQKGGYYRSDGETDTPIARERPIHDGAVPSANAFAAYNLMRLGALTGDAQYTDAGVKLFEVFGQSLERQSASMPQMLVAVDWSADADKQVIIVRPDGAQAGTLDDALNKTFSPNILSFRGEQKILTASAEHVPWMEKKTVKNGQSTAYVCRDFVCKLPTNNPVVFAKQLNELSAID